MARLCSILIPLLLLASSSLGYKPNVDWLQTTTTHSNTNKAPSKSSGSNGSSHIYFHQTFSDVKTDNHEPKHSQSMNPARSETHLQSDQSSSAPENEETSSPPVSYSTSIDHGDFGDRVRDPPSGITKRNVHYPSIPADVINDRDDDDAPSNDDDYGDDGEGASDDGGDGGGDGGDYDDDEPAESAPSAAKMDQDDGEVTEKYNNGRAQRIMDDVDDNDDDDADDDDGDANDQQDNDDESGWLADDDKDDFDRSASFSVPRFDGLDPKGCKTVYKEIKLTPTSTTSKLRRKRSATSSYVVTRECHFGNANDSDKTQQNDVEGRRAEETSTSSTPKPATAASSWGSRIVAGASQIPPPPAVSKAVSSTTKTALPDGSTSVSSFYMSTGDDDMQSSDSMPGPIHSSNSLSPAPSRHIRVRADLNDEKENMIPRPDKTRYHNFPYPHYHVYYDQPKLRDRIFARRWRSEYEKALKQQQAAQEAEKAKKPRHEDEDEYEDDENRADSESLAAHPPTLATSPDTSVDFTSQEKVIAGEQKSRQRRSRYANNPQVGRPKNIEYSFYREVNGPTTSSTPRAAPLDDYHNRIVSTPSATPAAVKDEPESDYADETRSDRSSAPLNDDDYGDDDGEGGQGEGSHDDGNDDYNGGGGDGDGSYDDGNQGQSGDDGQQGDNDNDDFFA